MNVAIQKTAQDTYAVATGHQVIDSLDGTKRAPLQTLLHESRADERAEYGIYVLDIDPPPGQVWTGAIVNADGTPVLVYDPIIISPAQVVQERARRLAAGFDFDFTDDRGVHRIGTTAADMAGWAEVTQWANAMQGLGNTEATLTAVTNTGPVTITPADWHAIIAAAHAFRQPLWQASFTLQAMSPIPLDYQDDHHW